MNLGMGRMIPGSERASDQFQAAMYNAGQTLITSLDKIDGLPERDGKTYQELKAQLRTLRDFHFNIGFAGGMSSGKSTVINSLIEYPLMPTCKLTTTCVGTHLFYGERPRICVLDDDTGEQVFNMDCTNISQHHFQKLKEYACITTHVKIIENLQHFTHHNLFDDKDSFCPEMLDMNRNDPNHVIILLMILLTVYVDQNSTEMNDKTRLANEKRIELLKLFGFPAETVNYTIQLQWNGEFLKSGMTITDLPGLGAYAPDKDQGNGKVIKGHDSITTNAIKRTDAMVFLVDPQVDGTAVPALQAMLSNAQMMEAVNQSDLVIPVLNKVDGCSKSERIQAVDKFVDILRNNGVDKTAEDVHLYSAWYGEACFESFSPERTCYFYRNFDALQEEVQEDADDDLSDMELRREMAALCRKELTKKYKKSGIEELKCFFRQAYIDKSKNRRSQAVLLAVIKLAVEMLPHRKTQLAQFDNLVGLADIVAREISKGLKTSIDVPISAALTMIAAVDHSAANEYVNENLEDVPEAYVAAFRIALDTYKKRNLAIINRFVLSGINKFVQTSFAPLGRARIDQLGSANHNTFLELCNEMEKMGVDVSRVNQKYTRILKRVTEETQGMYATALDYLRELKNTVVESMDKYVADCAEKSNGDETLVRFVQALRTTLVAYLENQIDIIVDNMKINQSDLAKAGKKTVQDIMDLNTELVNMYTASVVGDVKKQLSNGWFFASREYIQVTGSSGCKETFEKLSLTEDDRRLIEDKVQTVGISAISNNLNRWYQDAENLINANIIDLRAQLEQMIDNTIGAIGGCGDDFGREKEKLQTLIQALEAAFIELRTAVQDYYDASVEGIADPTLSKYRKNIYVNVIDMAQDKEE